MLDSVLQPRGQCRVADIHSHARKAAPVPAGTSGDICAVGFQELIMWSQSEHYTKVYKLNVHIAHWYMGMSKMWSLM